MNELAVGSVVAGLNGLDLFALIVIVLCALASLWRGAITEIFSLLGWIFAFVIARLYSADVAAALFASLEPAALRTAVAWVLCFIVIIMSVNLFSGIIKRLAQAAGLTPLDRIVGGLFGLAKAALLLLVLVWFGGYTPLVETALWKQSTTVSLASAAVVVIRQQNGWVEAQKPPETQPSKKTKTKST